jgi:hypothetical protein
MSTQDELLNELRALQERIAHAGRFSCVGARLCVEEAKVAQRLRSLTPGLNGTPAAC